MELVKAPPYAKWGVIALISLGTILNYLSRNALGVLKQSIEEGRVIERPDLAVSFAEINDLMGLGTIKEMERRFLTATQLEAKYGAPSR